MSLFARLSGPLFGPLLRTLREKDFATIVRGAGAVLFIRGAGVGLSYASMVLLARWMGAFEFGLYVYAWVWAAILGTIAVIGYDTAMLRFVPEYEAGGDNRLLSGVLRHGSAMVVGCSIVAGALFAAIVWLIGGTFSKHYLLPLFIAAAIIPFNSLLTLLIGVARGFKWPILAYLPTYILRPALLMAGAGLLILAGFSPSASNILLVGLASCVAVSVWQAWMIAKRLRRRRKPSRSNYRTRQWVKVALPMLLVSGTGIVLTNTDIVMLGLFRPPEDLAIYNGAVRASNLIAIIVMSMSSLAVPTFASVHARGNLKELQLLVRRVVAWTFWPAFLIAACLVAFGKPALWLFGEVFVGGYPYLVILVLGHLVVASAGVANGLLIVTGHERITATITASMCIVNIGLNAALIPMFGVVGASVATAISSVFATGWTLHIVRRRLRIDSFVIQMAVR